MELATPVFASAAAERAAATSLAMRAAIHAHDAAEADRAREIRRAVPGTPLWVPGDQDVVDALRARRGTAAPRRAANERASEGGWVGVGGAVGGGEPAPPVEPPAFARTSVRRGVRLE